MPSMDFPAGQVAVVTGAAGGIGAATAARYAEAGADVFLTDIGDKVHDIAKAISSKYPERKVHSFVADISDEKSVLGMAEEVKRVFGRVNHIAAVAGIVQKIAPVEHTDYAEWRRTFGVNIDGAFLVTKSLIPLLRSSGGGSIVTVSSVWGQSGRANFAAYCASKAAHSGLIQSLAQELAPSVRVNAVAPGHIKTDMHEVALQSMSEDRHQSKEDVRKHEWGAIPLGDGGDPRAIADTIVFLSSPASAYITGSTIDANGGLVFRT
ncbi:SDR family NAD(P)-dependent oxidoreductase [Paraburkholderia flagellata]|uniref:SDR family NAD(P)-dependent oxidoreductase n=1 Tax=Paraburkholderia flagellata TaxID=2883241 RepID=UPI001F3592CA|nr:SDR family oxidoreductase [Paraburkholderia flagellata]